MVMVSSSSSQLFVWGCAREKSEREKKESEGFCCVVEGGKQEWEGLREEGRV